MKPLVSIIVPCYNQAQYLPETLNSVLSQQFEEWECIIVNDGSPDNTEEVAKEWCVKDSRFKYFSKENTGVSDTRNFAIAKASGAYILPLDGDDIIGDQFLKEAVLTFNKEPDTKLVYSKCTLFGLKETKYDGKEYSFEHMLKENLIPVTALFRKSDFDATIGYNPNMVYGLEDWDFWLTFLSPSDIVVKIDAYHCLFRTKEVSRSASLNANMTKHEKALLQLFDNHKDLYLKYYNPIRDHLQAEHYRELSFKLLDSKEYRYGKFITAPFRFISSVLNKLKK